MNGRPFALLLLAGCEASTETLELMPPAGKPPIDPSCRRGDPEIEVSVLAPTPNMIGDEVGFGQVGGGLVYVHRASDQRDLDIVAIDAMRGGERVVAGTDLTELLLDANGDAAMWFRTSNTAAIPREVVISRGAFEVSIQVDSPPTSPFDQDAYAGRGHRMVDGSVATVRTNQGTWRVDEGLSPRLLRPSSSNHEPQVRGGILAFVDDGAEGSVRLFVQRDRGEAIEVRTPFFRSEWPAVATERVYFIGDGQLASVGLVTSDIEVLHPGPCGPPSTDGVGVVAACDPTSQIGYPAPGRILVHFDGKQVRERFDNDGYHYAPRLDAGRIVWLRYTSPDALCRGGRDTEGEVRFYDPEVGPDPIPFASVLAPCLCCDAFWPPAQLDFEGDVIGWNYARVDDEPVRFGGLGYAVIHSTEICAP